MGLKITTRPRGGDIRCPKCRKKVEVSAGCLGSFMMAQIWSRVEREGVMATCKCGHRWYISPIKNQG